MLSTYLKKFNCDVTTFYWLLLYPVAPNGVSKDNGLSLTGLINTPLNLPLVRQINSLAQTSCD